MQRDEAPSPYNPGIEIFVVSGVITDTTKKGVNSCRHTNIFIPTVKESQASPFLFVLSLLF